MVKLVFVLDFAVDVLQFVTSVEILRSLDVYGLLLMLELLFVLVFVLVIVCVVLKLKLKMMMEAMMMMMQSLYYYFWLLKTEKTMACQAMRGDGNTHEIVPEL